jgi:Lon protease-like protein
MAFQQRVECASSALKIFPLPSAVLFPGTAAPLHVFEPRYRDLVRDCLGGDRVMALADLAPGWEEDYQGRPPLMPIACAGIVVWHEQLPEGRYNILLQGVSRVRIMQELPSESLYRQVRATVVSEIPYRGPLEELLRQAVLEVGGRLAGHVAQELIQLAARAEGGALADVVAAALVPDIERRHAVLRELDPEARLRLVVDAVEEIIARIGAIAPRGLVH